jgi:hypothetical protein
MAFISLQNSTSLDATVATSSTPQLVLWGFMVETEVVVSSAERVMALSHFTKRYFTNVAANSLSYWDYCMQ